MRIAVILALALLAVCIGAVGAETQEQDPVCVYLFSSIGCSHCAKVDPVIIQEWTAAYPYLVVVDYELSQYPGNAAVFEQFVDTYGIGWGIPGLVISKNASLIGDVDILFEGPPILDAIGTQPGYPDMFFTGDECNITKNQGYPKIWNRDRVLIKTGPEGDEDLLKAILRSDDINTALCGNFFEVVEPAPVTIPGDVIEFEHAVRTGDWIVQWNGEDLTVEPCGSSTSTTDGTCGVVPICLTLPKIVSLAIVDAVNPCAMAVLTLVLIGILTNDPTNRRRVLWAGLSFSLAIFILYLVYGVLIVEFFQAVQGLAAVRGLLYTALGIVAVGLGLLQLKDFFRVGPAGLLTTMPKPLRPTASALIAGITSVPGAFLIGGLVTLFLLPCTIGPYVIAGGILSAYQMLEVLPYLLLYNAIFVLPMLGITAIVYLGITRVEDVSGWREENIRYLHGIAGTIMLLLGLGMALGLI